MSDIKNNIFDFIEQFCYIKDKKSNIYKTIKLSNLQKEFINYLNKKNMKKLAKLFNPLAKWINNRGWFILCILGAFGIVISMTGMIMSLITIAQKSLSAFFICLSIGLVVLGVAVFGIWGIVKLIKNNKDIFKI